MRPLAHYADIAQLAEQLLCKQHVAGSIPAVGSEGRSQPMTLHLTAEETGRVRLAFQSVSQSGVG